MTRVVLFGSGDKTARVFETKLTELLPELNEHFQVRLSLRSSGFDPSVIDNWPGEELPAAIHVDGPKCDEVAEYLANEFSNCYDRDSLVEISTSSGRKFKLTCQDDEE